MRTRVGNIPDSLISFSLLLIFLILSAVSISGQPSKSAANSRQPSNQAIPRSASNGEMRTPNCVEAQSQEALTTASIPRRQE